MMYYLVPDVKEERSQLSGVKLKGHPVNIVCCWAEHCHALPREPCTRDHLGGAPREGDAGVRGRGVERDSFTGDLEAPRTPRQRNFRTGGTERGGREAGVYRYL